MKLTLHPDREDSIYSSYRKILIIMKLTIVFLLLGMLQVTASVYSQSFHVTFPNSEITLGEALTTIEKNSDLKFFYRNDQVDINRKVELEKEYKKADDLLHNLLANTDIIYKMVDNNLVILSQVINQPVIIKGKVTDATGMPIPGVTVLVKGTTKGTSTNGNGEYEIQVTPENKTLVFSGM